MFSAIMNGSPAIKIVAGAIGLITILLIVAIVAALLIKRKKNGPGLSDKLPIGPMVFMSDDEAACYDRLRNAMRYFEGYAVYPKVASNALFAPRRGVHPKVLKKVEQEFITDAHDFVLVNRRRIPVAVIELYSSEEDAREIQATRAGLPVVRIDDPYIDLEKLATRLRPLIK